MISNTSSVTFGANGSINANDLTRTWEVFNGDKMEVKSNVSYYLVAWIENGATSLFTLDKNSTLKVSGDNNSTNMYSFENKANVVLNDGSNLLLWFNYHQLNSTSLTQYSVTTNGSSAALEVGWNADAGYDFIIDAGNVNITGPSGVYGTFYIESDTSSAFDATLMFANGTQIALDVDGTNNSADVIMDITGVDTFQVTAGTLNMLVTTYNGSPPKDSTRTVISNYIMDVGGTWGNIAVNGGYNGGHWTGAVSRNSYVLTATNTRFQHFAPVFYDRRAFFRWFLGVAQPRRKT